MKQRTSILGIGINDAEGSTRGDPIYALWKNMFHRCYREPVRSIYVGCTVATEWHRFSAFRAWVERQDWEGKALDKDLLFPGNRLYCPERCVFVDTKLNTLLSGPRGGTYGVRAYQRADGTERYVARINDCMVEYRLGNFATAVEASAVAMKAKAELIRKYAAEVKDERLQDALLAKAQSVETGEV